jgi:hypothetical protein
MIIQNGLSRTSLTGNMPTDTAGYRRESWRSLSATGSACQTLPTFTRGSRIVGPPPRSAKTPTARLDSSRNPWLL